MANFSRSDILTKEFLEECFVADFETGTLTWKARPRSHFRTDVSWKATNKRCEGKLQIFLGGRPPTTVVSEL